jgi:single-stranded-DNA-specific exonuclease
MTRIATRPYPFRDAERMHQSGVHPVMARLYAARGLLDLKELTSDLTALIPPPGLLHVEVAAVFLADAIAEKKKLVIVADYDCDAWLAFHGRDRRLYSAEPF